MARPDRIKLGKSNFNAAWLRSVTEKQAVTMLPHLEKNQVINAWKQANGLKTPKYATITKPEEVVTEEVKKPAAKKSSKKGGTDTEK